MEVFLLILSGICAILTQFCSVLSINILVSVLWGLGALCWATIFGIHLFSLLEN